MTQVLSAAQTGAGPTIDAIDVTAKPVHPDPAATDAQREMRRLVRTWRIAGLDTNRVDCLARDGEGRLYAVTNDQTGAFASRSTAKLWLIDLETASAGMVADIVHGDGSIYAKGMVWTRGEMVLYGQIVIGSNFLFALDLSTGAATIRGSAYLDDTGVGDPTSFFEFNDKVYLAHRIAAPSTRIVAIDTATGARFQSVNVSPADLDVNGAALALDGKAYAVDNVTGGLMHLDFSTPGLVEAVRVGTWRAPGGVFSMTGRGEPTLSFEEDADRSAGSTVFPGGTVELGHGEFTGTAGGPMAHHWSEASGAGAIAVDMDPAIAVWTAPDVPGNYVVWRRTVREGVLFVQQWGLRVALDVFVVEILGLPEVGPGEVYELTVVVRGNLQTDPVIEWTGGAFSDADGLSTTRRAGAGPGVETSMVSVTSGTTTRTASIGVQILASAIPGSLAAGGGSSALEDFVLDPMLAAPAGGLNPPNEATPGRPAWNRAPEVPGHPSMLGQPSVWRSHPLAFGNPLHIQFVGIDAEWKDGDAATRGAVQVVLSSGDREFARLVWFVVWQNGPWHYVRGRYFRRGTGAWPIDMIAPGESFELGGRMVDRMLSGGGVRQPFPNHDTAGAGFATVQAWQRWCFKRRLSTPSRLVVVPMQLSSLSRSWNLDVISNITVNAVHISDDAQEYVALEAL